MTPEDKSPNVMRLVDHERANNCTWAPRDVLTKSIEKVEEMEARGSTAKKMIVIWLEENVDGKPGTTNLGWQVCGLDYMQHVGLLDAAKHLLIEDWLGR